MSRWVAFHVGRQDSELDFSGHGLVRLVISSCNYAKIEIEIAERVQVCRCYYRFFDLIIDKEERNLYVQQSINIILLSVWQAVV